MFSRSTPVGHPAFPTQRSGHLRSLDIQTPPDIGQSNAPRPTFPRPLAPEISPALWVKVYCRYTHSSGDNHQNRYKSTSSAYAFHFRHRLGHYNKSHLVMTSGSGDIMCIAYGTDSGIAPANIMYRPLARSRPPGLGSLVTRAPPIQSSQEKTFSRLLMGGTRVYPTLLSFLSGTVGHPDWDPCTPHARLQPAL